MFNNLIESSSHRSEFRRRGSFFLFTTASYALLLVVAGVVSIYAYDASMKDQNLDLVTMMSLVDLPTPARPRQSDRQPATPRSVTNAQNFDVRRNPTASVSRPDVAPVGISTKANPDLPVRDGALTMRGDRDLNGASASGLIGPARDGFAVTGSTRVVVDAGPPPDAPAKPKPIVMSKGVINGEALSLPKPAYPPAAKLMHIQGKVSIQILIDETGKVLSARAIDGPPQLKQAAEKAAYQARFSPTRLSDQPVKVSGLITYNFVLEQ